jgi:hypothetical protein
MKFLDWYQFKLLIEHISGISMDALHVIVGFLLFVLVARLMKSSVAKPLPWIALLVLELGNEAYDLKVELWPNLASQIGEGTKDIVVTMFLPTLVLLLARWAPDLFAPNSAKVALADNHMSDGT